MRVCELARNARCDTHCHPRTKGLLMFWWETEARLNLPYSRCRTNDKYCAANRPSGNCGRKIPFSV